MKLHLGLSASRASRIAVSISAFAVLSSTVAHASQNYPEVIQKQFNLAAPPPCTLCHLTNSGGANTVHTRFGVEIRQLGALGGGNVGALRGALSQLGDHDSDGDTVSDVDELEEGRDPNVSQGIGDAAPPPLPELPPPLETGCALSRKGSQTEPRAVGCALLALTVWHLRARRRRNA